MKVRDGIEVRELAQILGGSFEGDPDARVTVATNIEDSGPGAVVRVESAKYLGRALASGATVLLIPPDLSVAGFTCIRVKDVRIAFLRCLELFQVEDRPLPGVHPTAIISADTDVDPSCSIGPHAVIGRFAKLGRDVVVHGHVVVGEEVEVGEGTILYPHVVLYPRTLLGKRVRIHAGAVIGADGFGYEWTGHEHRKRPHNGRVTIGDDVEIGANSTVDRATSGETLVSAGTKIDNLVQVGHNCRIGPNCILVSQVGLSGSVTLGNGVVLGGQVGVNTQVRVGDGARVGGQSGVLGNIPAGALVSGTPAQPHRAEFRVQAGIRRLPELVERVRQLEIQLAKSTKH